MKRILFLSVLLPILGFADIPVSLPTVSSSTTTAGGVSSFGKWSPSNGGFQISWNISQTGLNYSYLYTISEVGGGSLNKGVSTFILELNPAITPSNVSTVITSPSTSIVSGPRTFAPGDFGSSSYAFLPSSIYGMQVSGGGGGTFTFSFTSTNAPVWGSFYSDNGFTGSGSAGYAYNTGFSSNPSISTTDFSNWVPTVGGPSVIAPEPSTMLILGTSLAVAVYIKRRKSQKA